MKRFIIAALSSLSILAVSCYDEQLEGLNNLVDKIENEKIATIQEQVASISTSILDMQRMDTQLQGYITALQTQAAELEKSLASVGKKIEDVEGELKEDMDAQKVQILATLEEYKTLVSEQLSSINTAIADLQVQKVALENQIKYLKDYIDGEIQSTEDWASATFATLENYNALAEIVSGIQAQIETLNSSITDIDVTIKAKVAEELATATAGLRDSMKEEIEAVAKDCSTAINSAKEEITAAYEAEIKAAIANSEANMKSWVNTQLAKYYTATQVESKLSSLKSSLETQLESQKTYLMGLIESLEQTLTARIDDNGAAIDELNGSLSALSSEVATIARNVASNAGAISANAESIRANAKLIADNAKDIDANADAIEANTQLINANKKFIEDNNALIKANQAEIQTLKNRATADEATIAANAEAIADNAADIAANASLIAQNATAISNNGAAIAANAQEIENLKTQLQATKEEITEAYKAAISTAITTLDGKLSGQIATEVATLNSRIDSEVATINAAINALTARVATCEKDIKSIKTSIYNMQIEISDIQDQIEAILARIQSIEYIPKYSDGKATMYYTNNGTITPGSATFDFELQPAATAEELADVWDEALSMKAVHTQTRAAVNFVDMEIVSVTAEDGVLTVVASGADLSDDFYLGRISANACLVVSDGNNELASDYINMIPWTTDIIYVPDAAFKAYLVENFDADSDGEISEDEAMDIESIDLSDVTTKIATLAGVEYMKNLKTLSAAYHSLTSLDLSHNNALTEVVVNNNKLKTLDLSGCSAIISLECSGNKLTSLDVSEAAGMTDLACSNNDLGALNLTNNKSLVNLQCSGNNIATLNLKNLLSLETLYCRSNSLSALDLSKNTALKELDCSSNNLTTLNLNKNTELELVYCRSNSLTSLYLNNCGKVTMLDCSKNALTTLNLSDCKAIGTLNCSDNAPDHLDVTKCAALETLNCSYNALTSLDISACPSLKALDCSGNTSLVKLWVKDEAQQNTITITKDDTTTAIYYNNCGLYIPDTALKAYLVNNYDDNGNNEIDIVESDNITMINCSGKGVTDLTGLDACTNLVTLNCSNNNITKIELPNLKQLKTVTCNDCPIEKLNFDNCPSLQYLNLQGVTTNAISGTKVSIDNYTQAETLYFTANNTPFTSFTFNNALALTTLELYGEFTDVIVKNNAALTSFVFYAPVTNATISGNSVLEGIDVSTLSQLETLDVQKCKLQSLDVTKNLALTSLVCNNNELTTLDVSNNTSLVKLYCNINKLPRINVTSNTALQEFDLSNNLLSALNIRNNTALTYLCINNNAEISMVDVKYNTALKTLHAEGLAIGDINLSANNALTNVSLYSNSSLKTIVIWDNCTSRNDYLHFDMGGIEVYDNAGNSYGYPFYVGQYIPWFNGGIVYEVSNNGTNGKMVSVAEATSLIWSTSSAKISVTDSDNGANNMRRIKEFSNWQSKYPAFAWCFNYGKDAWYLPAFNELKTIYNNKSTINSAISATGYARLETGEYWSSTESDYDSTGAKIIKFATGDLTYYGYKNRMNGYVRAVLAF